jgi:hypothetical protein
MTSMGQQEPPRPDPIDQMVAWAADHVDVNANFEGAPVLLVGDPQLFGQAPSVTEEVPQDSWSWLELPRGRALVVKGPGRDEDGPWVWVLASDDGPLSSIEISPRLETEPPGSTPESVGTMESVSGRLVVGTPESIAWWGPEVDTSGPERVAEMRVDGDVPGPLRDGYIVVARLSVPGGCHIVVAPGAAPGGISGISIKLPSPPWFPSRPIIERRDG